MSDDKPKRQDVNMRREPRPPAADITLMQVWKDPETPTMQGGRPWSVEFRLKWNMATSTIVVYVFAAGLDEADIIRAGRAQVAALATSLVEQTAAWHPET